MWGKLGGGIMLTFLGLMLWAAGVRADYLSDSECNCRTVGLKYAHACRGRLQAQLRWQLFAEPRCCMQRAPS